MGESFKGTLIDLGDTTADVVKHDDGSYTTILMDNGGSRSELATIDTGNRDMLTEVLSWFTTR